MREVNAREDEAQQQHTTSDDAFNAAVMRLTEVIQSQQAKPQNDQADSPRLTAFTGDCWYCLKKSHMKRDCRKWKYEKTGDTKNNVETERQCSEDHISPAQRLKRSKTTPASAECGG